MAFPAGIDDTLKLLTEEALAAASAAIRDAATGEGGSVHLDITVSGPTLVLPRLR